MKLSINKFLIETILIIWVALFQGSLMTVYAQGPDEGAEEEPIVIAPSGQLNLTLEQLGYSNEELNKDQFEFAYRIDLPGNFKISPSGNYFDLITSHLLETLDRSASLQVRVNGRPLSALTLTADNAVSNTVRIDLPEGTLRTGRNWINLDLDRGDSCTDPGALIDVLVEKTSTLSFGYQQNPYPADLSLYPSPFAEESLLNIPVTIVLPDLPTSADLSVAATIAAGLGRMSRGQEIDLTAIPAGDLAPDILNNHHLIVIGQPDDNSLLGDLELPLSLDAGILEPGQGVLQEITSPWNEFRLILVVSGLDNEGVLKASTALNRQAHFLGMRGPVAIVLDVLPLPEPDGSRTDSLTLASLGYEDEVAYGAAPQSYNFVFQLPPGWQLEEPPFFVLKFTHADILDPYQSLIEVKLNGLPIGSTLLDESNASQGELTISLPRHRLQTGPNRLQVTVEMNLPNGDKCIDADDQRAWTVISSESAIFLPYSAIYLSPNLSHFPYPFSQNLGFDQTLFVLPDQPAPSIFNDMIQLAIQMGGSSRVEYISPRVAYASEVKGDIRKEYHLILLGLPAENALLAEVNDYLPQPFVRGNTILEPLAVDDVAFLSDANRDAGLLETTASPWNENYSLLAITGTTEEGYELTFRPLLNETWRLDGNLAVVEPTVDPLATEPDQISTYAVDTRSAVSIKEAAGTNNPTSEIDLTLLAKRWWE